MSTGPKSHYITLLNRSIVQSNGETAQGSLKLRYWEWQGHHPTVLFCHAASFHSRCYDRIINEALAGFHVIALDFRGHGGSQQHPPPYRFRWFAEDTLEFIDALSLSKNKLIGIGHSVGGYALTRAAAKANTRLFQSLLLLDPVIMTPSLYEESYDFASNTDYTLRRRSEWSSVEEMIARLEKREPFSRWPSETLRNYCTYALDENNKLVCAPDGEASIYRSGNEPDSNIYPLLKQSKFINDIPIHIVRASVTFDDAKLLDVSPTYPDLVKCFRKGRDTQLENAKHLFPMDQPDIVIDIVKRFMEENKCLSSHL